MRFMEQGSEDTFQRTVWSCRMVDVQEPAAEAETLLLSTPSLNDGLPFPCGSSLFPNRTRAGDHTHRMFLCESLTVSTLMWEVLASCVEGSMRFLCQRLQLGKPGGIASSEVQAGQDAQTFPSQKFHLRDIPVDFSDL